MKTAGSSTFTEGVSRMTNTHHLFLPDTERGLFNPKAPKVYPELTILTESVLDSLSLIDTNIIYLNDTSDITINFLSSQNVKLNSFPNEGYPSEEFYNSLDMNVGSDYNGRPIKHTLMLTPFLNYENCYFFDMLVGGSHYGFYVDGCGGEYYYNENCFGGADYSILRYFNKGGETWGTPFEEDLQLIIDYFARILSIADCYDAMTSRENDKFGEKRKLSPEEAKSRLLEKNPDQKGLIESLYKDGIFNMKCYKKNMERYKKNG